MDRPHWLSTMAYVVRWGVQGTKTDMLKAINGGFIIGIVFDHAAHVSYGRIGGSIQ